MNCGRALRRTSLFVAICFVISVIGCAEDNSPVIDRLLIPETADSGSRVEFQVMAHDTDGDALKYTWIVDGALLDTTAPTVEWKAPKGEGRITVVVQVSDDENEVIQSRVLTIGKARIEAPDTVPTVDLSKHSVPLEQVYFDTFRPTNRAVLLTEATDELIEELRDAIPPIHNPTYETAETANWLGKKDIVLGYATDGSAWAYPVRILNFHEIVNETLAGEPILISYCPLCFSGIVYSRRVGNRLLTFGNTSALYESDMVMLDYETGSYWWQVAGQAIVGTLTGEILTTLPSMMTTWDEWLRLYPETLVLSQNTGFARDYSYDPFGTYADRVNSAGFFFPVSDVAEDPRLPPATKVLVVKAGNSARAYAIEALGRVAIMDIVGDQKVAVFTHPKGPTGVAYDPLIDGKPLTFQIQKGEITDQETGNIWTLSGLATSGPLEGKQLSALPSKTTFWFAIVAAEPGITVYQDNR